jgi:hypothetical protein
MPYAASNGNRPINKEFFATKMRAAHDEYDMTMSDWIFGINIFMS